MKSNIPIAKLQWYAIITTRIRGYRLNLYLSIAVLRGE